MKKYILNINESEIERGEIEVYDRNGLIVYHEFVPGMWTKWKKNKNGDATLITSHNGLWTKQKWVNGNCTSSKDSNGHYRKANYLNGKQISYEDSNGRLEVFK